MLGYGDLHEAVERSLRRDVVEGVFPPGTRLRERELTQRYDVSRGPVREVLRALEVQGLVVRNHSKGVRVAELSLLELDEIYEMRVALEGLAARRAAEGADEPGVERVREVYDRLLRTPTGEPGWLDVNNEFHCAIYQLAGRPRLLTLIRQLMYRVEPYMRMYVATKHHVAQRENEHEEIWQALFERDANHCERITSEHLATGSKQIRAMLEALGREHFSEPSSIRRSTIPAHNV